MYERKSERLISLPAFLLRLCLHGLAVAGVAAGSLFFGMAGYHIFEGLPWRDAFLNASMLLGGMGPVNAPQTPAGKTFAGIYALYAGLVFLIVAGVMFAPVIHRIMHHYHWEDDGDGK